MCRGRPPARGKNRHFLAVARAAPDVAGNLARERARHAPDDRPIKSAYPARRESGREAGMGVGGLGDHHQPARILVETMDDPRPLHAADAGKTVAAMRKKGVDESPIEISRGRMDDEARRLIEHDEIVILVADVKGEWLRRRPIRYRRRDLDQEYLARF